MICFPSIFSCVPAAATVFSQKRSCLPPWRRHNVRRRRWPHNPRKMNVQKCSLLVTNISLRLFYSTPLLLAHCFIFRRWTPGALHGGTLTSRSSWKRDILHKSDTFGARLRKSGTQRKPFA